MTFFINTAMLRKRYRALEEVGIKLAGGFIEAGSNT
jgi:hypothetical protein